MTAPPHHHDDLAGAVDALASEGAIRRLMAAYLDAVDRSQDGTRIAGFSPTTASSRASATCWRSSAATRAATPSPAASTPPAST